MGKRVISLNEEDLRNLIKNTVRRFVTENFDEVLDTPERALHAVHAADADRKKHPGRSKLSKDPEIRAKRERQARLFGDKAAELMNKDMNNPDFMVTGGERGPRTLYMAKGKDSAYLRPDTDFPNAKVYNDDFKDGDTPRTMSDLDPEAYADAEAMFNKFKGYHERAKELDDKYLEEKVRKVVRNVIKENKMWDAMLSDMKKFAESGKDVYDFIEYATEKYGIDEDRFYTSGGYESWCDLTGEDPASYQI